MGNNCCTERDPAMKDSKYTPIQLNHSKLPSLLDASPNLNAIPELKSAKLKSENSRKELTSVIRDLPLSALITYLSSSQPITPTSLYVCWAAIPSTEGALAAARLIELIHKDIPPSDRNLLTIQKIPEVLLHNLKGPADKCEWSAIALEILTKPKYREFSAMIANEQTFMRIGLRLKDPVEKMRGIMSNIMRGLYVDRPEVMRSIRIYPNLDVVETMISILPLFRNIELCIKHLRNLKDFISLSSGEIIKENVEAFNKYGLKPMLEKLIEDLNRITGISERNRDKAYERAESLHSMLALQIMRNDSSEPQLMDISIGEEAEHFQNHIDEFGIDVLVENLNSNEKIRSNVLNKTWASSPSTVGALAAARLSEMFANEILQNKELKQELIESSCVASLTKNLASHFQDVREASAIALSHLIQPEETEFKKQFLNFDGLAQSIKLLLDPVEGMRHTISEIVRNTYAEDEETISMIFKYKSSAIVKAMLKTAPEFSDPEYFLYHLASIRDLYLNSSQEIVLEYIEGLKRLGLGRTLNLVESKLKSLSTHTKFYIFSNQLKELISIMQEESSIN
jgi:hypothetical protein